ncbi:hypothetical protein COBT_004052, partial [Conglomerata obtusa]
MNELMKIVEIIELENNKSLAKNKSFKNSNIMNQDDYEMPVYNSKYEDEFNVNENRIDYKKIDHNNDTNNGQDRIALLTEKILELNLNLCKVDQVKDKNPF